MKNILVFSSGSDLYGSERGLLNLVDVLKDRYRLTVVLPRRGPLAACLGKRGIPVLIYPLSILTLSLSPLYYLLSPFLFVFNLLVFGAYVLSKQIDCLYTNNLLIIFPSVIAALSRRKHVWHMREFFPAGWVNRLITWVARVSGSQVICQSQNIKHVLFPGTCGENVAVIYEGMTPARLEVDSTAGEAPLPVHEDRVTLAVTARIHPSKGQFELVELVERASQQTQEKFQLLIVGDVLARDFRGLLYKWKIRRYVDRHHLKNRVLFCGFRQDIPALLRRVDVCIFPFQRNEPFGLALLEALVLAKRVLVTMNPGSREILEHFSGKYRELSLETLVDEIHKGRMAAETQPVPAVFSFERYQQDIREFFKELGSR